MPTPAQNEAIHKVSDRLKSRDDIEALWLAGSLGAGEGDEWSDVDFLVLVAPDKIAALPDALKSQMRQTFHPVLVNELFGRVLNFITPDWLRFDLNIVTPPELTRFDAARLIPLFNKGLHAPPSPPAMPYAPDPKVVERLCVEFLRVLGLSAVCLGRGEYDVCLNGLDLLRLRTMDLMMEENAVPPSRRGGALKRYPFLTTEHRRELMAIPAAGPDRASIVVANQAFARLFFPRAKALCARLGAVWPEEFERATRNYLARAAHLEI